MDIARQLYNRAVRTEECWFTRPVDARVDILRVLSATAPEGESTPRTTLIHDLTESEAELLLRVDKDARYDIRRAEKDGATIRTDVQAEAGWTPRFASAYEALRRRRGIAPLRLRQLQTLHERGQVRVSTCHDAAGGLLTWHVYVTSPTKARLLYSASVLADGMEPALRAQVGRANRLHHWRDMLWLKDCGVAEYDFGGIYTGHGDPGQQNIAKFKRQFGGCEAVVYDNTVILTAMGRAIFAARLIFESGLGVLRSVGGFISRFGTPERNTGATAD